jgi:hypothetical protein
MEPNPETVKKEETMKYLSVFFFSIFLSACAHKAKPQKELCFLKDGKPVCPDHTKK